MPKFACIPGSGRIHALDTNYRCYCHASIRASPDMVYKEDFELLEEERRRLCQRCQKQWKMPVRKPRAIDRRSLEYVPHFIFYIPDDVIERWGGRLHP